MAAPHSAQPDLEALLTRSVGALVGDDASLRFGVAVSGGPDSMAMLPAPLPIGRRRPTSSMKAFTG